MKTIARLILLLSPLILRCQSSVFDSEWIGPIVILGQSQYASLNSKNDTTTLQIHSPLNTEEYLVEKTPIDAESMGFSISKDFERWEFNIETENKSQLEGIIRINDLQGKFTFYKRLPIEKEEWQPYIGNFRFPSGGFIKITQGRTSLFFHSSIGQEETVMKKIGDHLFLSNSLEMVHFSNFENGKAQQVEWRSFDGQNIKAKRVAPYRVEEHIIITNTDTIGASLYLPNKIGKHPACLILSGAARYDRSLSDMEAEIFATYGFATLIYDNYGVGQSNGDLLQKSFVDKQQQAIELFRWLQQHDEIDPLKIGIRGASQGGRIAIMAAAELPETAFLLLLATPLETRMDQQLYAYSCYHRNQGYSEVAISQSTELWRRYFLNAYAETIDTSLVETVNEMRTIYPEMALPAVNFETPPYFPWKEDILMDGESYLSKIDCPVLCLFGSNDDRVPAQKSINQLTKGLKNKPTVYVYDGTAHSFQLPGFRIVKGLFMRQIRFMEQHTGSRD